MQSHGEGAGAQTRDDARFMDLALDEADRAAATGEVPVGAVIVLDGRAPARELGNYRLPGVTLYSTVEPCAMCCGAVIQARVARLVYGAADPKAGAVESLFRLLEDTRLNHRVEVTAGVRSAECGRRLSEFFRTRRL